MKKFSFLVLFFALFVSYAQNPSFSDIKFWAGSGDKVAMFVVDFNDGATNECYAWGYRFDGDDVSAMTMLEDIAAADPNFSYAESGGFLSDIHYLTHSGVGGSPNWWSTFNFQNNAWVMNMGYSELLSDSTIFGNSYTEWDANYNPVNLPGSPIAAKVPFVFTNDNVRFWVGQGAKKALFVADFNDGFGYNECYVWGYKFDGDDVTAEEMINAITTADTNLSVSITSGFLSDMSYLSHVGEGGNPNWWSTFSLSSYLWEMNMGISEVLVDNCIFGASYTDWDASFNPVFEPESPLAASKPFFVNTDEVVYWVGSGSKKAYLVVDFNDGAQSECYIWGYRFDDDNFTIENMIEDIVADDYHLTVNMNGGFLSDINYFSHVGIGGDPNWWSSFTLQSHIWEMNFGISEILVDNMMVGFSYTEWDDLWMPINDPQNAVPASLHTSISKEEKMTLLLYPNPSVDKVFVEGLELGSQISIYASNGALVYRSVVSSENVQIDVSKLSSGSYILNMENGAAKRHQIFVKQ
jgi:hypothetical protein